MLNTLKFGWLHRYDNKETSQSSLERCEAMVNVPALEANVSQHSTVDGNVKSHVQFSLKKKKSCVGHVSPLIPDFFFYCFLFSLCNTSTSTTLISILFTDLPDLAHSSLWYDNLICTVWCAVILKSRCVYMFLIRQEKICCASWWAVGPLHGSLYHQCVNGWMVRWALWAVCRLG